MFLDLTSTRTYYHGNCMLGRGNWLKGLLDSYFKWWLLAGRQQTRATTHKIAVAIYGMLGRNSCAIESASMLTSFVDIQMLNMDKTPCPTSMALHCASLILVSSECPFNAYEHTACRRALRTYSKCPEYGGKPRHSRVWLGRSGESHVTANSTQCARRSVSQGTRQCGTTIHWPHSQILAQERQPGSKALQFSCACEVLYKTLWQHNQHSWSTNSYTQYTT